MRASTAGLSMRWQEKKYCVVAGLDLDLLHVRAQEGRLAHVPAREPHDLGRHGRGEQQRLAVLRGRLDELLDIGQEAEVQHLVGLVQHQRRRAVQAQVAAAQQVQQPPRRADHDAGPGADGLDLRLDRAPP